MLLDFSRIKFKNKVGIGEASHGTREYQKIRLQLLKFLHKRGPMQVLIEAPYYAIEHIKQTKTTEQFNANIDKSAIFDFYKSTEFKKILQYLYKNDIPFYGTDIDHGRDAAIPATNATSKWVAEMNKKLYSGNNWGKREWEFREKCMQELAGRLDDGSRQVYLAHNYHVSKKVGFVGTSIGFATLGGTVRAFDEKLQKYVVIKIDYSDQQLKRDAVCITKTKKWFYQIGNIVQSDRQKIGGELFDYVIFVPKTTAIAGSFT